MRITRRWVVWVSFFVAISLALGLMATSCGPQLRVNVESFPPGASITIDGIDTGRRTPAFVKGPFPPPEKADGFASYNLELESEAQRARGRVICWDGGFPYPVFIRRVESLDGSAWTSPFNDDTITVKFSQPNMSFLVMHWWEKHHKQVQLDQRSYEWTHPNEIHSLSPGTHRSHTVPWMLTLDVPERFCIQVFEWGSADENVYLCFPPEQFKKVTMCANKGRYTDVERSGPVYFSGTGSLELLFEAKDGRECSINLFLTRFDPNLHLRVSCD